MNTMVGFAVLFMWTALSNQPCGNDVIRSPLLPFISEPSQNEMAYKCFLRICMSLPQLRVKFNILNAKIRAEAANYAYIHTGLGQQKELCMDTDQITNCGYVYITRYKIMRAVRV